MKFQKVLPTITFSTIGLISLLFSIIFGEGFCLLRGVIGIPCPSCGMTRSFLHMFHGDIGKAFWYHPLFLVPIIICILAFFEKMNNKWIFAFIGLFLVVWVGRMIFLFPAQITPMVMNENGVLFRVIELLQQ